MTVKKFLAGPFGTNCYLAVNDSTKEAVIVDPAGLPENLMECVKNEGLRIQAVLLTHAHFDHIMGIDAVIEKYGQMPVYVHQEDLRMLEDASLNLSGGLGGGYTYMGGEAVADGQALSLAGCEFQVFHTPGHTPGGACYYVEADKVLFSGDTLFQMSVGRTDFPGGSMSELVRSIEEKLLILPEDTHVYPGHMGTTTIGEEKGFNPFL
jgi:glyoxylase-like metal-dependent hydrolase (beta-lactamase superfamily II)